eukprot:371797_1
MSRHANKSSQIIDCALSIYYRSLGVNYYSGPDSRGKFLKFVEENAIDDDTIKSELSEDTTAEECLLLNFDGQFPMHPNTSIHHITYKPKFIHFVLQYCLKHRQPPKDINGLIYCMDCIDCDAVVRLEKIMKDMMKSDICVSAHAMNVSMLLDDFLHIITEHDDDEAYSKIYSRFGGQCVLDKCMSFSRNERNRNSSDNTVKMHSKLYKSNNTKDIVKIQIMDKIHCYCHHSYDTGHRLAHRNKNMIQMEDSKNEICLVNQYIVQINETIAKKQAVLNHDKQRMRKFYFKPQPTDAKEDVDDIHSSYSFGYAFHYPHPDRIDFYKDSQYSENIVKHKYSDLKKELLFNSISRLLPEQFNQELVKAKTHFNSKHRKLKIRSNSTECRNPKDYMNCNNPLPITLQDILSTMIYCNYDILQYELCKTYRKIKQTETLNAIKERHSNFYWIAKYLKECITYFGVRGRESTLNAFYHGIGQTLHFTTIFGGTRGTKIHTP